MRTRILDLIRSTAKKICGAGAAIAVCAMIVVAQAPAEKPKVEPAKPQTVKLSADEQKMLDQAAQNLVTIDDEAKQAETIIARAQAVLAQRDALRNAYLAVFYKILSGHKLNDTEAAPAPDRKSIVLIPAKTDK
jgi:hypothetical protein